MKKTIMILAGFGLLLLSSFSLYSNEDSSVIIKVTAGAFMEGCGNEVIIEGGESFKNFQPELTVQGAIVFRSKADNNNFIISPTIGRQEITITVFHDGKAVKVETFPVWKLPKPELLLYSGDKLANWKQGEPAPGPSSLTLEVVPDVNLARFFTKDATYQIGRVELILVRGRRPLNLQNAEGSSLDLTVFASMAQPGDRILVEIKELTRTDFRGQKQEIDVTNLLWNIPLY